MRVNVLRMIADVFTLDESDGNPAPRAWKWVLALSHFKKALAITLVLHLLLIILLPPLPVFKLSGFEGARGLIVTLLKEPKEPEFDASLNQNLPLAANVDQVADPSLGAQSEETGDDSLVSDQQDISDLNGQDSDDKTLNGNLASKENTPSIRFDFASIRVFAKQEAVRYADIQPRKVERFARTFNRSRSQYRRNNSEAYRDQYGDIYARSNSSSGDVCYKQKRQDTQVQTDLGTNTVYFFRCDSQPIGFDLKKDQAISDDQSG